MQLTIAGLLLSSTVLATPLAFPASPAAPLGALSFDLRAPKAIKRAFDKFEAQPLPVKRAPASTPANLFARKAKAKRQSSQCQFTYPNTDSMGLTYCPATDQRYPSDVYVCYPGQLCKVGFFPCGEACYSPMQYGCNNNQLVQGASAVPSFNRDDPAAQAAARADCLAGNIGSGLPGRGGGTATGSGSSPQVSGMGAMVAASQVSGIAVVAADSAKLSNMQMV